MKKVVSSQSNCEEPNRVVPRHSGKQRWLRSESAPGVLSIQVLTMSFISPQPRDFGHRNILNNKIPWGVKYQRQRTLCQFPSKHACIIGDSYFERLSGPSLLPLFQTHLKNYLNLGIGGDKAEHIYWRVKNGCLPVNLENIILSSGSNNVSDTTSSKDANTITNTILETVRFIKSKFPNANLILLGIFPRNSIAKCERIQYINDLLQFKLPTYVIFINPPKNFTMILVA